MKLPIQITAKNIELTDAIENEIQKRAERLDQYYPEIMSCRVVVEAPHKHQRKGLKYDIKIDLKIPPGKEIVIKRQDNEDLYVAIRDAFDAARRKLEDVVRKLRGDMKRHKETPQGIISRLFRDDGYGFITSLDGKDIYFHKNSVINYDFKKLEIGTRVRYIEELGEKGPQASTVSVIEK